MNMPGMSGDSMAAGMPIPMPKGMPMIPGLVGLTPAVTLVPPGRRRRPRDGAGREAHRRPSGSKTGDTLDLTAGLVRRTIRGQRS